MAEQNEGPFFKIIETLLDRVVKIEPRVTECEWRLKILWWVLATISAAIGGTGMIFVAEWVKSFFVK